MANEPDFSFDEPVSNSIFTTPLSKQTAKKFGMKIEDDSTKQRRLSLSSLNKVNENLYVTPRKITERMNVLNDGSKSVNFISKMNFNSSIKDSINNNTIFDSPSNKKNTEVVIIDDNENSNINKGNFLYIIRIYKFIIMYLFFLLFIK